MSTVDLWARRRLARGDQGKAVANPGCFPAATQIALAPLLANRLIEPDNIVIDAKTGGISGAGRSDGGGFSFAASNENLIPYGVLKLRPHAGDGKDYRTAGRFQPLRAGFHSASGTDDPGHPCDHLLPWNGRHGAMSGCCPTLLREPGFRACHRQAATDQMGNRLEPCVCQLCC